MIELPQNLPLIKFPKKVELIIFLIKEELKNRKFSNGLDAVGFDTSMTCSDLSPLVLGLMGFDPRTDELYSWYYEMLETNLEEIDLSDMTMLFEKAFEVYVELVIEKRKQEEK